MNFLSVTIKDFTYVIGPTIQSCTIIAYPGSAAICC
jgi:hypothetical protein